jgi:hypothetical protein
MRRGRCRRLQSVSVAAGLAMVKRWANPEAAVLKLISIENLQTVIEVQHVK